MKMKALAHVLILMSLVCIFAMVMTHNGQAQSVDESLVLYLPFDEENGNKTQDLSQYEHEVKITGKPEWKDGRLGSALDFDGIFTVDIPVEEELLLTWNFTVEFWAKRDGAINEKWNTIVSVPGWYIGFNAGARDRILFSDGAPQIYSINPLPESWTHVAVVFDMETAIIIYLNGEEDKRTPTRPPVLNAGEGTMVIGGVFRGIVDELAIYNRVLSPDEIQRDMKKVGGLAVSASGNLPLTWGRIKVK